MIDYDVKTVKDSSWNTKNIYFSRFLEVYYGK